jgi:hypothetical protein
MVVAREWQALENGSRWRIAGAGEWQAPETGSRWRMGGAGEWESLARLRSGELPDRREHGYAVRATPTLSSKRDSASMGERR